ncbi:MAG: hypothetical protein ACREJO_10040 [Phycisphaerales bacterium]
MTVTLDKPTSATASPQTAAMSPPPKLLREQVSLQTRPDLAASQEDFQSVISRARTDDTDIKHKTRQAAEDFVAVAFIQPILKQLRETNHAAPPFAPSEGEKAFRGIADAHLSRQLVRKARWPLVDRLARTLLDKAEGRVAPHPAPRYGPHLDKVRPQLEPVKNPDAPYPDATTSKPELDTQA